MDLQVIMISKVISSLHIIYSFCYLFFKFFYSLSSFVIREIR